MSSDEYTNHLSIQNAPDAQAGMALIHAMSMACQKVIDVKMPTGQVRPVSLNMLIIAESGQSKTSINSGLLKAIAKENT